MMTKDFEPITEVGINQDDFGEGIAKISFHLALNIIRIGYHFNVNNPNSDSSYRFLILTKRKNKKNLDLFHIYSNILL